MTGVFAGISVFAGIKCRQQMFDGAGRVAQAHHLQCVFKSKQGLMTLFAPVRFYLTCSQFQIKRIFNQRQLITDCSAQRHVQITVATGHSTPGPDQYVPIRN